MCVCVFVFVCVCVCCGTLKKCGEKPVCGFKNASVCSFETSPCMLAPRAHTFQHVRVVPVHTGDVLNGQREGRSGGGHRQFCSPRFAHVGLSRASERFTKETLGSNPF